MEKSKEKFWQILSEPYVKNCNNCIHGHMDGEVAKDDPTTIWLDRVFTVGSKCNTCNFLFPTVENQRTNNWEYDVSDE